MTKEGNRSLRLRGGSLGVRIVAASIVAAVAAAVAMFVALPRAVSSTTSVSDDLSVQPVGSAPSLPLRRQALMNETENACTDLAAGMMRRVLEGVLGVVRISRPTLARVGPRISLTCRYSSDATGELDHVTVTTVSGRLSQARFVRLVTSGVTPRPSRINHALSTLMWEWAPTYPEAGVLSMLHDGRVTIVQVAVRGAKEHELKAHALDLAESLNPDLL